MKDIPKPKTICPECGCKEAFYHCALQDDSGVYNWGTLATCLMCKTPFTIGERNEGA